MMKSVPYFDAVYSTDVGDLASVGGLRKIEAGG